MKISREYLESLDLKALRQMLGSGEYKGDTFKLIRKEVDERKKVTCAMCGMKNRRWYQPIYDSSTKKTHYACLECLGVKYVPLAVKPEHMNEFRKAINEVCPRTSTGEDK